MADIKREGNVITLVLTNEELEAVIDLEKKGSSWLFLSFSEWLEVRLAGWKEERMRANYNKLRGLTKEQKDEIKDKFGIDVL